MKRIALLALLLSACSTLPAVPQRPAPTNPQPAPSYTAPASLADVATVPVEASEVVAPVTSGASNCLVIVKRTATAQVAKLDYASCKGQTIWLNTTRAGLLFAAYGLTTDNTLTVPLSDAITREDGGLIVQEIGALERSTDGYGSWAS